MTTPGYPDWERVVRAGQDPIIVSRVAIPSTLTLAPVNVQQWASIMLFGLTGSSFEYYQINWLWYDDANKSNLLSSIFQIIGPNWQLPIPVPVAGPWLVIEIVPHFGSEPAIPIFTFFGLPFTPSAFEVNTYSQPILNDQSATAANTIITFTGANVHYGNAKLHINPPSGPINTIVFKYWNWSAGAYETLYQWDSLAAGATLDVEISMPAAPWQLSWGNGATAQSVLTTLMPKE